MTEYLINVFFSEEDGGWIAEIPDLEGCSAFGSTPEDAVTEVQLAKEAWLETARDAGRPIPEPRSRPTPYPA